MALGTKRMYGFVSKHLKNEVRVRVPEDKQRAVIFELLTGHVRDLDPLSRDGMVQEYISDAMTELGALEDDERVKLLWRMAAEEIEGGENMTAYAFALDHALRNLRRIERLGSVINPKLDVMRECRDNPLFVEVFRLALDNRLAFGFGEAFLGEVDLEARRTSHHKNAAKWWRKFTTLTYRCAKARGVPDKIKARMKRILLAMPKKDRMWAVRILMRDLRIRIGVSTARRVWPSMLHRHDVQLCDTIKKDAPLHVFDCDHEQGMLPKNVASSPKLDGYRMTVKVLDARPGKERGVVQSRSGLELPQHWHLVPQAAEVVRSAGLKKGVLDGEGTDLDGKSWAKASSAVNSRDPENSKANLRFQVFDLIPLKVFEAGKGKVKRGARLRKLTAAMRKVGKGLQNITLMPFDKVPKGTPKVRRKAVLKLYQKYRRDGYEGSVLVDLDAPYHAGDKTSDRRLSGLYRIKPFEFIDVMITGSYEGKGDIEGMLGGFTCITLDGTEIRVGGGYTLKQRADYWSQRKKLVGRVMEVERQEDAPGIKSRHTNHKRLRDPKDKNARAFLDLISDE